MNALKHIKLQFASRHEMLQTMAS